jgi:AraC family transcriptional regulator
MHAEITTRADTTVVGLQIRTLPMSPDIPAVWPRFVARIPEIEQQAQGRVAYGVMGHGANGAAALDYMAAVAVHAAPRVPEGMTCVVIPGGTYALFRCPLSHLAFSEIFLEWLPASGFVQRAGPYFERYDEDFDPARPDSLVEIGVPVAPRASGG